MIRTRRDFGKFALALLPASTLMAKQDSKWGGVQVGINAPYSFKGMSGNADKMLEYLKQIDLNALELRLQPVEAWLGAPGGLCLSGRHAERECGGGTGPSNWACFDSRRAGSGEEIARVAYLAVDGKDQGIPKDV